jgi:hypothetical protein
MTIPYFYIIQHKKTKIKYAGCKYSKGSDPKTFMQMYGYTTSSNIINNIIKTEGLYGFDILTMKTEKDCGMRVYDYETRWLNDHMCAQSKEWFNKHNNHYSAYDIFQHLKTTIDPDTGLDLSTLRSLKTRDTKLKNNSYKYIGKKISEALSRIEDGLTVAQKRGLKLSKIMKEKGIAKGKTNPQFGKYGINHPKFGKFHSEEAKRKQSESNKKPKNKSPCHYCSKLVDPGNMKRWHGEGKCVN